MCDMNAMTKGQRSLGWLAKGAAAELCDSCSRSHAAHSSSQGSRQQYPTGTQAPGQLSNILFV